MLWTKRHVNAAQVPETLPKEVLEKMHGAEAG